MLFINDPGGNFEVCPRLGYFIRLFFFFFFFTIVALYNVVFISGEGDGTPLQYSCLENPMDGGA